jgi:hypothetical protein
LFIVVGLALVAIGLFVLRAFAHAKR